MSKESTEQSAFNPDHGGSDSSFDFRSRGSGSTDSGASGCPDSGVSFAAPDFNSGATVDSADSGASSGPDFRASLGRDAGEVVNQEDEGVWGASEASTGPEKDVGRQRAGKRPIAGRRRKKGGLKGQQTYKRYLRKVLQQIDPKCRLSLRAMSVMNSLMVDIFEMLATEASRLASNCKKPTIAQREMQTAVKLTLPGELAKHALMEGNMAVMKSRR